MNKIRINRLLLAGLATLIVFIIAEIFIEYMIGGLVFGNKLEILYRETKVGDWGAPNQVLNILLALVNNTLMIWLYVCLRPMFGVGYKTALITSGIAIILGLSMTINGINLGLFPARLGLIEWVAEAIELPIAMIAGSLVYEGITEAVAT